MSKLVVASANHQLDILLEIVCVKLQLTKTQFGLAESRYHSVGDWLLHAGSAVRRYKPDVYPQGSLNLGTTVKPYGSNEFDLDVVCELQVLADNDPAAVYQSIWDRMAEHETYAKMIKRLRRCIRLEYANEFHLDIVPAIPDPDQHGDHILVPDLHADLRKDDPKCDFWKPSNPRGYKEWFKSRCAAPLKEAFAKAEPLPQPEAIHEKPALKRAVQLFKRWRDVEFKDRRHLEPPSVILTTLAGHFHGREILCTDALETIIDRIVDMRDDDEVICQTNPANPKENICERWRDNPKSLEAFDGAIREFQVSWKKLLKMRGLREITTELKRLFGENPVDQAVKEFAERQLNLPREAGQLLMERDTRRVVTGGATVVGLGAAALPVRPTTFFGEE
jgi:hypothetical protein